MINAIIKNLETFVQGKIDTVYADCFFQLTQENSAIIYRSPEGMWLHMTVQEDNESDMVITDISNNATLTVSSADGVISCDDERMTGDLPTQVVARFLNLMEGFVHFAESEG